MVLSNKKLKQKLREAKTQQLTASEAQINHSIIKDVKIPENPSPKTQESIQSLLKTVTQKPKLSKREKRRENLQSLPEKIEALRVIDGGEVKKDGDGGEVNGVVEESKKEKKKKKRKRGEGDEKDGGESVEVTEGEKAKKKEKKKKRKIGEGEEKEGGEDVEAKEAKEAEKAERAEKARKAKKKKKQKKKRKVKKKVEDVEVKEEVVESAGGGAKEEQQVVVEAYKTSESIIENPYEFTKVYVGGIPYYSTEDDIRSYFESCGTVTEIDCMYFPESGKFRGIAIIAFKTEAAAKRALALDGSDMGGLYLKIQPYKSTRANTPFVPAIVEGYNKIYVGNLSWDITEDDLRKLFSDCNITSIRFGEDKETKEFKGYGHVEFADSLSVNVALKLDQHIVCGRPIRISRAVPKKAGVTNVNPTQQNDQVTSVEAKPIQQYDQVTTSVESKPIQQYDRVYVNEVKETQQIEPVVSNEVSAAVSAKIRRRTCYECGERGHLSSSCPKMINNMNVNATQQNDQVTSVEAKSIQQYNQVTSVEAKSIQQYDQVYINEVKETQQIEPVISNEVSAAVSAKIRRRTCYECGERGHLSSSCPKKQATDEANAVAS